MQDRSKLIPHADALNLLLQPCRPPSILFNERVQHHRLHATCLLPLEQTIASHFSISRPVRATVHGFLWRRQTSKAVRLSRFSRDQKTMTTTWILSHLLSSEVGTAEFESTVSGNCQTDKMKQKLHRSIDPWNASPFCVTTRRVSKAWRLQSFVESTS